MPVALEDRVGQAAVVAGVEVGGRHQNDGVADGGVLADQSAVRRLCTDNRSSIARFRPRLDAVTGMTVYV